MDNIHHSKLQVTSYDRIHGSMVAAILVFGFLFLTLLAIWWSHEIHVGQTGPDGFEPVKALPLTDVSFNQNDFLLDVLPPTAAPRLSNDLAAVADVVSSIKANETISIIDGIENSEGSRELGPIGIGGGTGIPGPPTALPEFKRWSVVYRNPDFNDYIQMLNELEIEVGVIRLKSNEVIRIENPGNGPQVVRSDRAAELTSFYFHNTKSTSRRWDTKIVRDAEIDLAESVVVHFYPEPTLEKLRTAEANQIAVDEKTVEDVLDTKFAIEQTKSGFEIWVKEIDYR